MNDHPDQPHSYDRDDSLYEYIEQGHMLIYPSEKAGWEQ